MTYLFEKSNNIKGFFHVSTAYLCLTGQQNAVECLSTSSLSFGEFHITILLSIPGWKMKQSQLLGEGIFVLCNRSVHFEDIGIDGKMILEWILGK
jgi:hypothetical protein